MTRATVVRAVLAAAVLLASVCIALTTPPRLGLDLKGGTQIVLRTQDSATVTADGESTDLTMEVLRRRIDALGVAEPTLTRSGQNRIIVELPDVQNPREAAEVLGRTAQLTFHPVEGNGDDPSAPQGPGGTHGPGITQPPAGDGDLVLPDESGRELRLGAAVLTGSSLKDAEARFDAQQGSGWSVSVEFRGDGKKQWARLTGSAACHAEGDDRRRVAIVLDNEVISAPQVERSIGCGVGISSGATQITGMFSAQEARELALLIKGGALPVPVDIVEQRTVGPTLGAAAISASARAAVIGVALTSLFIMAVYRLLGALAAVALAAYGVISYATLVALGVTLTLPGLAGFVLAIGMAVDANVLVFERAREEHASGGHRTLRSSLAAGFRRSWSAIADSNVTTLLAAGLLFLLASGPVRGFGVTLAIGVVASMFSALVIARVLAEVAVRRGFVAKRPGVTGVSGPGWVRRWLSGRGATLFRTSRRWLLLSALLTVLAVAGIAVRGLNFGVEFTGGRLTEYTTARTVEADVARHALARAGLPHAEVNSSGEGGISVRTAALTHDEERQIHDVLAEHGGTVTKVRDESIGPSIGNELRRNALIALSVALLAQFLYLAVRFRRSFALASVAALAHDVTLLLGAFAWMGRPVDGIFLAALLTVIGYSVNDSVVVFDRVRELWAKARRTPFPQVATAAVLQTVPRTVNTGMGALFILTALAILGGDSLRDFALALLIGIVVGTYSSVFLAVPASIALEARRGGPPPRPVARIKRRLASTARTRGRDNGAQV